MARKGVRLCLHKDGLINKLDRFGCLPFLQSCGMMQLVCSTVTTAQRSGSCPLQFSSCVLPHSVPLLQPVHVPCPPQRKSVCLCLSTTPRVLQMSVYQPVCPSLRESVYLSTCLSVHHSVSLSTCLSVCPPLRESICLSVHHSVSLFVYMSVCRSACLSITP